MHTDLVCTGSLRLVQNYCQIETKEPKQIKYATYGNKFYLESISGSLLFNSLLCNLFFIINDIDFASYQMITYHAL